MDQTEKYILQYYCNEKGVPFNEELVHTDEFKDYVQGWAARADKANEIKMEQFENKMVSFVQKVIAEAKSGIHVEIEAKDEEQRKGMRKSLKSYLKATEGHDALMKRIRIVTKDWKEKNK